MLNAGINPNILVSWPANKEPKAIANVKAPDKIPTALLLKSNPFCHTVIVADNPTIIPEPSIEPIPAPNTKVRYFLGTLFFSFIK